MIILLGFPKCGTTSFQELFNKCSGFKGVDCITQMDVCIYQNLAYWPQIINNCTMKIKALCLF